MNKYSLILIGLLHAATCQAGQVTATLLAVDGTNKSFGTVEFKDTDYGLLITPNLSSLPQGLHGFHLHQHADCGNHGMGAGAHFDPNETKTHQGPYGTGHLGDLPVLSIDADGQAHTPILAPRLKTRDLSGLTMMVHAGGDNYSDTPALGGGGTRIACGVIK